MKKFLSAVLVILMTAVMIASCAGESVEEIVPAFDGTAGETNFEGMEFILSDIIHHGDTPLIPTYGENALDDQLIEHYKKVQEKLNFKLTLLVGDTGKCSTSIASGIKYTDMMNVYFSNVFSFFKSGFAVDFNFLDGIDLHSGKFGNENFLDALTFGTGTYGVCAAYWGAPTPYFANAMMFNPRLISQFGQTSPYELYENGTWDWDTFEKMAIAVTDTTSNPDFPIYASGQNGYFTRCVFFSNGAKIAEKDANGRLVYALPSKEVEEAADYVNKLFTVDKVLDTNASGWEGFCDKFINGQYVFLTEYAWVGISKDNGRVGLNMEEEFSWIPFPKGPSAPSGISSTYADANFAVFVPINADDQVGTVLDALFEPLFDEPYGWHENFRREVFWDDQSFEIYMAMMDNAVPAYDFITSDVLGKFTSAATGKVSVQEAFASIADSTQALLDGNYNKYLK